MADSLSILVRAEMVCPIILIIIEFITIPEKVCDVDDVAGDQDQPLDAAEVASDEEKIDKRTTAPSISIPSRFIQSGWTSIGRTRTTIPSTIVICARTEP